MAAGIVAFRAELGEQAGHIRLPLAPDVRALPFAEL